MIPNWADKEFSEKLPRLRSEEEGQRLEFKEAFPEQAHHLAEEIAAFATAGGGTILIGVHNDGTAAGLAVRTEEERDALIHRAQGIVRAVRPQVNYELRLGSDEGHTILGIEIGKQEEPVFYYDYRPYIRDGRAARRAEPNEVKELIHKHPSAEHQRKIEELLYQQSKGFVEDSRAARQHYQSRF